ncbi:MAG: MBL fold metallo-hydrolase RNA specificity domain-containing protein, partial [Nitrososphaeria archaeon]
NVEYTEFQRPAEPSEKPVGSLIMEATYGDTPSREERNERVNRLIELLSKYTEQGKFVFLPVFAKGRFDEVVSIVDKAIGEGRIRVPAIALGMGTEISAMMGRRFQHVRLLTSEDLREIGSDVTQSIKMVMDKPLIVIASSGFLDKGVSEQLISEAIKRSNVVVIKTGYAPPFSMAGRLTKKGDKISIIHGEEVTIECDVENVSLSAHAAMDDILNLILKQNPHDVIFIHRESKLSELKKKLSEHNIFATAPPDLAMVFTYGHYVDNIWDRNAEAEAEAEDTVMYQCECGAKFQNWSAAMMHINATGHRIIDRTSVFVFKNPKMNMLPEKYSRRIREKTRIEDRLFVRADFTDEEAKKIAEEIGAESVEKQSLVINARMNFPAFVAFATEKVSEFLGVDLVTPHTVKRNLPFG